MHSSQNLCALSGPSQPVHTHYLKLPPRARYNPDGRGPGYGGGGGGTAQGGERGRVSVGRVEGPGYWDGRGAGV